MKTIYKSNYPGTEELSKKLRETRYIVGLDLHKKTTGITVVDKDQDDTITFQRKRLKNNKLLEILKKYNGKKF